MTDREAEQLLNGAQVIEAVKNGAMSDAEALSQLTDVPMDVAKAVLAGISEAAAEPELTEADKKALAILNGEA